MAVQYQTTAAQQYFWTQSAQQLYPDLNTEPGKIRTRSCGWWEGEKPRCMQSHAPISSHTYRLVLRHLKLGRWLQGGRLCSRTGLGPAPQPPSDGSQCTLHLISVGDLGVRQLSRHELEQNYSVGIDVRLEAVGIIILHPDDLGGLQSKQPRVISTAAPPCWIDKVKLSYQPSRGWSQKAAPPGGSRSTWP